MCNCIVLLNIVSSFFVLLNKGNVFRLFLFCRLNGCMVGALIFLSAGSLQELDAGQQLRFSVFVLFVFVLFVFFNPSHTGDQSGGAS